jgi:excisionase family DNA binding protein
MLADRVCYRPEEAAAVLGVSRDVIFKLLADKEIRSFRSGRVRLIPVEEIRDYVQRKMAEAPMD